jgi:hypothetical protein
MKTKCLLLPVAALGGLFTAVRPAFAQSWKLSNAPTEDWQAIASSADGSHLVAVAIEDPSLSGSCECASGTIYTSIDSGATWTLTSAPRAMWMSVVSSADGSILVAVSRSFTNLKLHSPGRIYTSTNSGATWKATSAPDTTWSAVASSADGTKLVAADGINGPIYTSSNSGATWTATGAPGIYWNSLASSADGSLLLAAGWVASGDGVIYTSTDSGATWTLTSAPSAFWFSVASSVDGSKLAAVGEDWYGNAIPVYTSSDSGTTWTAANGPIMNCSCVACSADGSKLVAGTGAGPIYTSTDSGATWTPSNAPSERWFAVASSADGSKLVAGVYPGGIYTWQSTTAPLLSMSFSGGNVVISWPAPAINFVLQQNPDLTTTNWTDVITAPTVTNLQNQVVLPAPPGNAFYRLKSQ